MVQPTIATIKELHGVILTEYSLYLSRVNSPQEHAKAQRGTFDALLQQLQSAIDEMNSGKAQEIKDMQDSLAMQEQQL
jgi:hypothetical protein